MPKKRVQSATLKDVEERGDRFENQVTRAMSQVLSSVAKKLGDTTVVQGASSTASVSPNDINGIIAEWAALVESRLLPEAVENWILASNQQLGWLAAAIGSDLPVGPYTSESIAAQAYASGARNRLTAISDDLWQAARTSLVEGMAAGESVPKLAARVRESIDVSRSRATTIARTEVISATNLGSLESMRASGVVVEKVWLATMDARTRESHADADGQRVGLNEPFDVAGFSLDCPGDPIGPPEEVINCRCTMIYEVDEDETSTESWSPLSFETITAADTPHTGVMIAVIPDEDSLRALAVEGGDPIEDLHVTIAYLGNLADLDGVPQGAPELAEAAASGQVMFEVEVAGYGTLGDEGAAVLFLNSVPLDEIHDRVMNRMEEIGPENFHEQHKPWIPHLTLGYGIDPEIGKQFVGQTFIVDRVRLAAGDEVTDTPLDGTILASIVGEKIYRATTQEVTVQWHIEHNHPECPAGYPWAVVNSDTLKIMGFHPEREFAVGQLTNLSGINLSLDTEVEPVGDITNLDGEVVAVSLEDPESLATKRDTAAVDVAEIEEPPVRLSASWHGVLAVEGLPTGDGRMFAEGALTWPDPSETTIPLRWQKEDSHGGQQVNGVVNIGRIDRIEREGQKILGWGVIDLESEDGREAHRRMGDAENPGYLSGVSIDADDPEDPMGLDIEYVYPEGCEAEGGLIDIFDEDAEINFDCMFPELMVMHSGRIRAATMVDLPAFVEARLHLLTEDEALTASAGIALEAVTPHTTETSDSSWDGAENESRLPSPMSLETARAAYAWIDEDAVDDDQITKSACKFIHHEVNADGTPGPANLTACSSGIAVLNGARGGTDIDDVEGVYEHLARHLRDADQEPPPLEASVNPEEALAVLTASTHIMEIPGRPPREWFDEPSDVPDIGALTVTDEGRVYGYLAPKNIAHRGFTDRRVEVPMRNVDYGRWMNRTTIVAGGDRIATGPITMECGHASAAPWVGADMAVEHYDNSCSIVAAVRVGENSKGVWIAGALLPDVTAEQVARMMMCQLSGDWRPHRERPGKRELTAALLVPVPGFPMESPRVQVRVDRGQLVASAVPVRFAKLSDEKERAKIKKVMAVNRTAEKAAEAVGESFNSLSPEELKAQADEMARELGLDQRAKLAALAAEVRGE